MNGQKSSKLSHGAPFWDLCFAFQYIHQWCYPNWYFVFYSCYQDFHLLIQCASDDLDFTKATCQFINACCTKRKSSLWVIIISLLCFLTLLGPKCRGVFWGGHSQMGGGVSMKQLFSLAVPTQSQNYLCECFVFKHCYSDSCALRLFMCP